MQKVAILDGDTVSQVIVVGDDYSGPGTPCPDTVSEGWSHDAGAFSPPAQVDPRPLADQKAEASRAIAEQAANALRLLTGEKPREEVDAWPAKQRAVERFLAGELDGPGLDALAASQLSLIQREATRDGLTLAEMASAIVAKAALYHGLVEDMDDIREGSVASVEAASDSAGIASAVSAFNAAVAALISS